MPDSHKYVSVCPPQFAASNGGDKKPKRAAWDLKGRLEDMEKAMKNRSNKNSALEDMINANNDRIQQLENQNSMLKGTVAEKEEQTSEASETIRQLKRKLQYVPKCLYSYFL